MMKVLLLLANGFELYEASVFTDVIGWDYVYGSKDIELVTCGIEKEIESSFNHRVLSDMTVDDVDVNEFDALAIPGGFEKYGFYKEAYDDRFLDLIRAFHDQSKIIASVCVGALPLGKSGILTGKRATTYNKANGVRQDQLREFGVQVVNEPIVVEGKIVTSWNPSTAIFVAYQLLEMLTSKQNADHIKELMGY
ncbi:MAG TPA: DJ-1/PfpI family protein [Bacillota bacterium]|nr:DJ-1/PfpI family protein [Bacillota bacterium]